MHTYRFYWMNCSVPTTIKANTVEEAFRKTLNHSITNLFKYEVIN